jgi:excisionase family DNA binding protein
MRNFLPGNVQSPEPLPKLTLSVDQAAHSLGISSRSLKTLIGKGELKVVRIGRRVLVSVTTLEEFIRAHEGGQDQ